MDSDRQLVIGYAGSLNSYFPSVEKKHSVLKDYLWTYQPDTLDFRTRSGYYLFKGLQEGKEKGLLRPGEIKVKLWGLIDAGNQRQVKEMGLQDMVEIEGYVPKSESMERLDRCDLLFLPLECGKDGGTTLFIPGKVFEYLKLRKPVLCLTNGGDCADILRNSKLGVLVSPFDSTAIAEKLAELVRLKSENRFTFAPDENYICQFSFHELTGKLAGVFDRVLRNS